MKFKIILFLKFFFLAQLSGQDYELEKLNENINSPFDEITPVPSRDGKTLFFTRVGHPDFERTLFLDGEDLSTKLSPEVYHYKLANIFSEMGGRAVENPVASTFNQDVWISFGDSLANPKIAHPGFPLNNAFPNSIVATTPDPNAFYVINQFSTKGDLRKGFSLIRKLSGGLWNFPEPVEIKDFYTITSDVSLTMSLDGQILILSASRFDSRDMDLYVCFREGENTWSVPQNLGTSVNSAGREISPFLSEDNQSLFFSSNRPESMGGNDIFMCKRQDNSWKNWSAPVRLAEPINSFYDDSQPYFNMNTGFLYFSSRRDGSSDIFRIQIAPPQPIEITLKGRVVNAKTGDVVRDAAIFYGAKGMPKNELNCIDGNYSLAIPKGVQFELIPEKPGYSGKLETAFFQKGTFFLEDFYVLDLMMEPFSENSKIQLRPIFFQQSKAVVLEKSFPEIEKLASILEENPGIHIRIEGHTDNNGKTDDLERLSEERANAVKEYLVGKKKIDRSRIQTLGQGSKYPLNDNSTDELRQQNRRVEFIITKT